MKTKELKHRRNFLRCIMTIGTFVPLMMLSLAYTGCSDKDDDPEVYTVSFDADGGSPVPAVQRVEKGSLVIAPSTNPAKTGYVFVFWHLDGTTTAYNFNTPVSKDITLFAKWQKEATAEYWQVTWNLNGGAWPSGDDHATQVVKGGTLAEPAAPTKTGKVFDGWYKEAALTNKINFPYSVSAVTADFTLYAKWSDPAVEYWKITWELNGGVWPSTGDNHVTKVEKGSTLSEPTVPIKEGDVFDGWYKETTFTNKITFPATVTGDFKLYAKWAAKSSSLQINMDKVKHILAYTIQVTEEKKKGLNPTSIQDGQGKRILSVYYNTNGTIRCIDFSSYWALTAFSLNTPVAICEVLSNEDAIARAAASAIYNGTYDYANDPAGMFVYFGSFAGTILFTSLNDLKKMTNNDGITEEVYDKIQFPTNCYKVIVFGKNSNGEAIGKHVGYSLTGKSFTYWCIDPDDASFGKSTTVAIP